MDMKKILQALDSTAKKPVHDSNDMKKFMSIVTEGTNRQTVAEQMIVQEYTKPEPKKQGNGVIKHYFNEVLKESEEKVLEKKARARLAAERVLARMEESKNEPPKPRNFVAKNAKTAGAGAHKDKKKAAKQGDVKHKGKELAEVSLGDYRKKASMDQALAKIDANFSRDPAKQAKAHHTIAKREKGLGRAKDRSDRELAAMASRRKSEHEDNLRKKYSGVDIDAEIVRLQPAIKNAYNDYQYGASNTWSQGKDEYDHLMSKVRELKQAKELLSGVDEGVMDDLFGPSSNPQIDQLKAMLADPKYASNPQWKAQLEKRLKKAQDRQDILGTMAADKSGNPIKVLPPDQYKGTLDEGDEDPCWADYKMVGTKKKGGKTVPNCVPKKKG